MPRKAGPPAIDDLSITLQTLIMGGFNKHSGWLSKKGGQFFSNYKAHRRTH